jgi:hypothetical protein
MHHLKYACWGCALVALALVGCADAQPTAVSSTPTVGASPFGTTAPSLVTSTPTKLPIPTIVPTSSAGAEWNFDNDPVGGLPKGAEVFEGRWAVRPESDAPSPPNALCQTGNAIYPALKLSDTVYKDVVISVRFKPISGREDQAAGIIFRVQDKDNFYILRANALEGNVNFYKYAGGQRNSLNEAKANVLSGRWQELRVEASGNQLRAFVNGQMVNEIRDDTYREGKIGLWTKADSVTCFDNVQVTAK